MAIGAWFGGDMMLLWWLGPIALAIAPAVYLARRPGAGGSERTALDILKERYARNAHSVRPLGSDQ
ncbi:MAG: hypothetical protein A3G26_09760 [Betaproteobacteria bacterium RIFCSPLOWO2_12_FULL_65_110]|nr:MAG: hypothetical protein A3G26_09760 [Betaproteobacteria bacterium RIFCSPLOWO2_12_FULL_65_110]